MARSIVAVHGINIAMKNSQIQTFIVASWSMNSNNSQIQKFPDTNIYTSSNLEHDYMAATWSMIEKKSTLQ
jgi:hypothetical protein